ncbi:MAG: hypothetical protein A3F78_16580 [Burkholderiales bacterium RIFCSPLOWO2_12_FULL_61_40]|nr:MAG: hypothetical protein A3F78_16580 [Burkholderiales bacterium RIFCSPLOWO2_12_FULL_61_40]
MTITVQRTVAIVQRILPHYRVPFFNALWLRLAADNINLRVIYGQEYPGHVPVTVKGSWPWAEFRESRYLHMGKIELVWQPCLDLLQNTDLLIVEQANRLLANHLLQTLRVISQRPAFLGLWGHGRNLQARENQRGSEWLKRKLISNCDWWFAYTSLSAGAVKTCGYPVERITCVNNTIEPKDLRKSLCLKARDIVASKVYEALAMKGKHVGLFCGGMYADKQLPFLMQACHAIRDKVPDFEMIFVGHGPDQQIIERACARHNWMHYVGAKFGIERAKYFAASHVFMMPGLVGLAIIDAFVSGLPMVTTDIPIHSPEIAYLENGINGVMTSHRIDSYADGVVSILLDEQYRHALRQGCAESATRYTLEAMVTNFTTGILDCLRLGRLN